MESSNSRWTKNQVLQIQREITASVAAQRGGKDQKGLVAYLRSTIKELQTENTSTSRLKLFHCGIHLLLELEKLPRAKLAEAQAAAEVSKSALLVQGIKHEGSIFSYLYGTVEMALGQFTRRQGHHFQSMWHQLSAARINSAETDAQAAFVAYASGNRALRLGNFAMARQSYKSAGELGLLERWTFHFELQRFTLGRLSGDTKAAKEALQRAATLANSKEKKSECEWQEFSLKAQMKQDLTDMIRGTRRSGGHFQNRRILEMCLWAMALPDSKWLERLPNIHGLRYDNQLELLKEKLMNDLVVAFQSFREPKPEISVKLASLGTMLSDAGLLVGIVDEVLVWAAGARQLSAAGLKDFAQLCAFRYESLSRELSGGKTNDCLDLIRSR